MCAHRFPLRAAALASAALLGALPGAALAQSVSTEALVFFGHHPQAGCREDATGFGLVEAACGTSTSVSEQSGVARAAVLAGQLAVFASADQQGGVGSANDVQVRARAAIHDRVLINAAAGGLAGQRATMTYTVHLSGVLLNASTLTPQVAVPAGSIANSALYLSVNIGGLHRFEEDDLHRHFTNGFPGDLLVVSQREASVNGAPVPTIFGSYTLEAPFTFGQGFEILIDLDAVAGAVGGPMSSAASIADSSHTFAWGGIEHITFEGQVIDGFTMVSSLGIDWTRSYAAPVPQPVTAGLLACGLAAMGLLGRRRLRAA